MQYKYCVLHKTKLKVIETGSEVVTVEKVNWRKVVLAFCGDNNKEHSYVNFMSHDHEYNEYKHITSTRKNILEYTSTMYSSLNPVVKTIKKQDS